MRIIAGTHKGRKIKPPNHLAIRPTTDRAKEALFSIIDSKYFLSKKNMLDLFSGTGNIALEFTSRGVTKAVAVDNNINCTKFITATAKSFELNVSAIQSDALKYAQNCKEQFNFIFADPPYCYEKYQELKEVIIKRNLIKKDGLLIIEHDKKTLFDDDNVAVRRYGIVHFSLFSF
jgi:16S rRNA (guanine(966)-N(2))-methyltransferase RsmD